MRLDVLEKNRLMTQSEYAKKRKLTRAAISIMVKENRVDFIEITGAKLIYLKESEM